MKRHILVLPIAVAVFFLAGCGSLQLNPVTNESRLTRAVVDATQSVTVIEGMVWSDKTRRTRGMRFPPGQYPLEAEDADYRYFRSPAPLEFRTFDGARITSMQNTAGGLMIAKGFNLVPAAGYVEGKGSTKVMVWKIGQEFPTMEGKYWTKSF